MDIIIQKTISQLSLHLFQIHPREFFFFANFETFQMHFSKFGTFFQAFNVLGPAIFALSKYYETKSSRLSSSLTINVSLYKISQANSNVHSKVNNLTILALKCKKKRNKTLSQN